MVCRLLKALEGGHLPDDLGELAVDGIVYLSPAGAHPVNFPNLFADLCRLLPPETADRLLQRYRDPHETPAALMRALLDAVPSGRVVVLLDNAEDVIDAASGEFGITDAALDEALRALLSAPAHGVKVILTTRVAPRGLLLVQPERQRRLDLDEGLDSPYAEQVLRARDPDGRLGLKTAPDELLGQARQRTRGYPRALEALTAILAADRNTTLPELLAETRELPGNVVEVLVGEAFSRLDAPAQQVMQALAIYTVPVPPVAVDYLLQPYRPAVDAAPVLGRLVNMQFVRREAGRYHLHQVDRDYALSRLPAGEPGRPGRRPGAVHPAGPAAPRRGLLRADPHPAGELEDPRRPGPSAGRVRAALPGPGLRHRGPGAARHRLRVPDPVGSLPAHRRDAPAAAGPPRRPGHRRRQQEQSRRLLPVARRVPPCHRPLRTGAGHQPRGRRPGGESASLGNLGNCYSELGQIPRAIESLRAGPGHRPRDRPPAGRGRRPGCNLGNCYVDLGQIPRAIGLYEQALAIAREIGDQEGEANPLGNLGNCYSDLGQIPRAIGLYEQALAIARQIGYRYGEALDSGRLGERVSGPRGVGPGGGVQPTGHRCSGCDQ